jgi:hypothetical protein
MHQERREAVERAFSQQGCRVERFVEFSRGTQVVAWVDWSCWSGNGTGETRFVVWFGEQGAVVDWTQEARAEADEQGWWWVEVATVVRNAVEWAS